jgi:hypothetical protein
VQRERSRPLCSDCSDGTSSSTCDLSIAPSSARGAIAIAQIMNSKQPKARRSNADRGRRLPSQLSSCTRPTCRSRRARASHHGLKKRIAAYPRRRFKRKSGGFWRAQFCTEMERPKRFELLTPRFVVWASDLIAVQAFMSALAADARRRSAAERVQVCWQFGKMPGKRGLSSESSWSSAVPDVS